MTDEPLVDLRRLATRATVGGLLAADLLVVLFGSRSPLTNPDTFVHLRFGEEFLHHWSIAHPGQPNAASSAVWVPTQWLSEMAWTLIHDYAGRAGLGALYGVLIIAVLASSYAAARSVGDPLASIVAASAVLLGGLNWMGLRPQLISYVLIALTVRTWTQARNSGRTPWLLIPLTWVWAMCHGMWILGVAIGLVSVVGLAIEDREARLAARRLAVPLFSVAAAGVTPVGPRLIAAVFAVNSRSSHFSEWQPVFLLRGWGIPVTLVVTAVIVSQIRSRATPAYVSCMICLTALFAVYSGRTVVPALIVAAPLLAEGLRATPADASTPKSERPTLVVALLAGLLAVVVGCIDTSPGLTTRIAAFHDRLGALPSGTTVITERAEGELLLWAYPRLEVPVDGYGDVFTNAELDRYDGLSQLQPGWVTTLHQLNAHNALLPRGTSLAYALTEIGWRVVQRSGGLEYLVTSPRRSGRTTPLPSSS